MKNSMNDNDKILEAIGETLKKLKRLNSTIQVVKSSDEPDELSIDSLERIKTQLTKDLGDLLATFDINIKVEAKVG